MWPQSSALSFVFLTLRDTICRFMRTIKRPYGEVYMENSRSFFLTVLWETHHRDGFSGASQDFIDCSPIDILNILTATYERIKTVQLNHLHIPDPHYEILNVCIFKPLSLGLFLTQQHISNTDKNIIDTDSIEDIMIYCGREDKEISPHRIVVWTCFRMKM